MEVILYIHVHVPQCAKSLFTRSIHSRYGSTCSLTSFITLPIKALLALGRCKVTAILKHVPHGCLLGLLRRNWYTGSQDQTGNVHTHGCYYSIKNFIMADGMKKRPIFYIYPSSTHATIQNMLSSDQEGAAPCAVVAFKCQMAYSNITTLRLRLISFA